MSNNQEYLNIALNRVLNRFLINYEKNIEHYSKLKYPEYDKNIFQDCYEAAQEILKAGIENYYKTIKYFTDNKKRFSNLLMEVALEESVK